MRRDNCLLVRQVRQNLHLHTHTICIDLSKFILVNLPFAWLILYQVVDESLKRILVDRDVPGAVSYVKHIISELLMNKMDLSLLVITKVGENKRKGTHSQQ